MPIELVFTGDTGDLNDAVQDSARNLSELADGFGEVEQAADDAAGSAADSLEDVSESAEGASVSVRGIGNVAKSAVEGDLGGALTAGAGLLRAFGPAGAVAGGVAAGGIALITAALGDVDTKRAEVESRAGDLAAAFIEAGSSVLTSLTIAQKTADILTDPEQTAKAQELVDLFGIDLPTAARVLAGDVNALAVVQGLAAQAQEDLTTKVDAFNESQSSGLVGLDDQVRAWQRQIDKADELTAAQELATSKYRAQQQVLLDLISASDSAEVSIDKVGSKLYELPDGSKIVIDAETGQATTDLSKFKGDADGVIDHVSKPIVVQLDTSRAEAQMQDFLGKKRVAEITAKVSGSSRQNID